MLSKNKIKIPCTGSNDKLLLKYGCPTKYFDSVTGEGCPKWKEYTQPGQPGNPPVIIKGCIDILLEHWQFESLKLLEGSQRATESLRNGLCEEVNDKIYPKSDRNTTELLSVLLQNQDKLISMVLHNEQEKLLIKNVKEIHQIEE